MDLGVVQVANSVLIQGLGSAPVRVSGLRALVQEAVIELLSDPLPERSRGAGLAQLVAGLPPQNVAQAKGTFAQAVSTAKTHILANQRYAGNLTANERLKDMNLTRADLNGLTWELDILLTNVAGESATFTLPTD